MASNDQMDYIRPGDFNAEGGIQPAPYVTAGNLRGLPLNKLTGQYYDAVTRIWSNGTPLTTGLTFGLELVDEPGNSNAGLNVRLGFSFKRMVSGTADTTATGFGTEQVATFSMPATSGVVLYQNVAVVNANLPASLAAGDRLMVRVRRLGTDALDTGAGIVLLTGLTVRDT